MDLNACDCFPHKWLIVGVLRSWNVEHDEISSESKISQS